MRHLSSHLDINNIDAAVCLNDDLRGGGDGEDYSVHRRGVRVCVCVNDYFQLKVNAG